jgi:hypothetical protein
MAPQGKPLYTIRGNYILDNGNQMSESAAGQAGAARLERAHKAPDRNQDNRLANVVRRVIRRGRRLDSGWLPGDPWNWQRN